MTHNFPFITEYYDGYGPKDYAHYILNDLGGRFGEFDLEFHREWIAALRSGNYQQMNGALHSVHGTFCCLGVACHIKDPAAWKTSPDNTSLFSWDNLSYLLPMSIAHDHGIITGRQLADMNDKGWTFAEIADALEVMVP